MLKVEPPSLEEAVWQALGTVIDPELGLPLGSYLAGLVRSCMGGLAGVSEVQVHLASDPPWTIDRMSARARSQLGCK
jgi:metal-sulfur cluster biosynthetic enzyme